ncbi:E3 ubiquitin-protein ligase RNF135 isoform X4 [Rhineura floridana]|uniref:E3 ubiquitin-protein ligase RNF135 isoform X4 n=1 Tax=Rhineura floridana TaxID=261503 RepID=UPI002AC8337A|nr:E3 ubiquitin-protein ligase RNF135 isoform X4 [Rhineura floridana]
MATLDLGTNLQDELTCCLCLDFFNNPVLIIQCSHSFCKGCISQHCKEMGYKASCPKCRGELHPNNLVNNRSLANIVEIFQQMKNTPRTWERVPENCQGLLGPFWRDHEVSGSQDLKLSVGLFPHTLKDVVKISEISKQTELALEAISTCKKKSSEMKNTSLEQEVYIGDPITVNEVVLGVQISSILYAVEEFKKHLEKSVLGKYQRQPPQKPSSGASNMSYYVNEIHTDVAEDETPSTSNSYSRQETSSCSSAMSSAGDSPVSTISTQFSQWASNVTFDHKRAHKRLEITKDKRKVIVTSHPFDYEHSPKRFCISQVMGSQGFSEGRHYWEVSTKDSTGWAIGVATEDIGGNDQLGRTELSWCIEWSNKQLLAWYRNQETQISEEKPLEVGVFLDIPNKRLSFYSLTGKETFLYHFEINVVSPLYPAFWIYGMVTDNSLTLNNIKKH